MDPMDAFLAAAVVPRDAWHATGTLEEAEGILAAHPELAGATVYTAAVLGDDAAVRRFLERNGGDAAAKGGPYGWDALTHLCFSRYLKLDPARSDGFVRAATALLDAGADANTGFFEDDHDPEPEWESALYGAAGVAHHPDMTRLLVGRGARVNDEEVVYHAPETYDLEALRILVETGRLTAKSLCVMLLRKHDWHDAAGVRYLLDHGADPNQQGRWGLTALHHAIQRDNALAIVEQLLDHGAAPSVVCENVSAFARAARRGRSDLLVLFERRGFPGELTGLEELIAACARDDADAIAAATRSAPGLADRLAAEGGRLLAEFAGNGNTAGVGHLLDLGVDVDAPFREGDGYWGVARDSTALHVAAWRARHDTVGLLLERGATAGAVDGKGRTPLLLAVKACVDSYWTGLRSPESVRALLDAGARVDGVPFPSGYEDVDALLRAAGADG